MFTAPARSQNNTLKKPMAEKEEKSFQFLSFKVSMMLPVGPHFRLSLKAYGKESPIHLTPKPLPHMYKAISCTNLKNWSQR